MIELSSAFRGAKRIHDTVKGAAKRVSSEKVSETPGSPQSNYESRMKSGEPLTELEVVAAKNFAASMGTRFDARTGYADKSAKPKSRFIRDELSDNSYRKRRPGETITERDTRVASAQTKTSKFVPFAVREAELKRQGYDEKGARRMAAFQSSTAGQRIFSDALSNDRKTSKFQADDGMAKGESSMESL